MDIKATEETKRLEKIVFELVVDGIVRDNITIPSLELVEEAKRYCKEHYNIEVE